jgi:very-short-patch-repair endonuclease
MSDSKQHRLNPHTLKFARELRQNQSPAEIKLWSAIRNSQVEGLKFRRQVPFGRFIVDFYCASAKLIIEVDGDTHAEQEEYDQERTNWLTGQGLRVIRFTNDEVMHYLNDVAIRIIEVCKEQMVGTD